MKKYYSIVFFIAVSTGLLISCKKDVPGNLPVTSNLGSTSAFIKVYNVSLGTVRNYVYYNSVPVNGVALNYLSLFPANVFYDAIYTKYNKPSTLVIKDTLASSPQPAVTLTAPTGFIAGSYYSIFLYDTATTIKSKLVFDNIVVPDDTTARIRFANLIFSRTAIPNVDIYSKAQNKNVFTNIPVETVTGFIPYPSKINDSLLVRPTGTTTNLAGAIFQAEPKRSYTLIFNGRYQTTGTAAPARALSIVTNR